MTGTTSSQADEICDLPLAPAHRGLLALVEAAPDTTAYHVPVVLELSGVLDLPRLQTALDAIAVRHEVLRSVVAGSDRDPVLRVRREGGPQWQEVSAEQGQSPLEAVRAWCLAPMDLREELPVRFGWARDQDRQTTLVALVASHVLLDGPAVALLLEDLETAYAGTPPVAQPLDVGDVLLWLEERGVDGPDQRFWDATVERLPVHWPPSRPGPAAPAVASPVGRVTEAVVPEDVVGLRRRARDSGTTVASVVAAAWSQVLAAWAGETSVSMLAPMAGRGDPTTSRVVGNLTTVLPVRWRAAPGEPVADTARRAMTASAEALAHASAGLPELTPAGGTPRPGRQPWSDVILAVNEVPRPSAWCGLPVCRHEVPLRHAKCDLCLDVRLEGDTVILVLDHRCDVVVRDDAAALLAATARLLRGGGLHDVPRQQASDIAAARPSASRDDDRLLDALSSWLPDVAPHLHGGVGCDDDLLVAGLDSLALLRLVARARREGWDVETASAFSTPTLRGIASAARRAAGPGSRSATDVPVSGGEPVVRAPTDVERRMWLLHQVGDLPEGAYVVPAVLHLEGNLDVAALQRAVALLPARHPALRTTVQQGVGGELGATTWPEATLDLELLPSGPPTDRVARDQVDTGLDPSHLPLARASLVQRGRRAWDLVVTVHHVAVDDRSAQSLVEDLWRVYAALVTGRKPPAVAGAAMLRGTGAEEVADAGRHWARALASIDPAAPLHPGPATRARGVALDEDQDRSGEHLVGNEVRLRISPGASSALRARAAGEGATPFMALLASIGVVHAAHTGQTSTCMAVPLSAGVLSGGPAQGNQTRTVPVLVDSAVGSWTRLLGTVRKSLLDGLAHSSVPFEEVVEQWQGTGREGPLFRVLATWQDGTPPAIEVPDLEVVVEHQEVGTAKTDLTVVVRDDGVDGWSLTVRFDPGKVGPELASRWARDLDGVLRSFAGGGRARARPDDLQLPHDVVAPEERRLLRAAQHRPPGDWQTETGLHALVDQTLRTNPERVVVRCLDDSDEVSTTLTAGELDRRSRVLQQRLRRAGVRYGDHVGLLLPRGVDLVVAELAVLRLGGAIVPLAVSGAPGRLREMATTAGLTALCATEAAAWWDGPLVPVHDDGLDPALPSTPVRGDEVAYVMFTSGSTGAPKAVPVDHRSIVNNLRWMQDEWPLTPADRLLWKTVETFDVSVKEVFWPLLSGAELLVAAPGVESDAARIARVVARHRVSVVHLVPSVLDLVLRAREHSHADLSSLEIVMCGAEAVRPDAVRRLQAVSGARLVHLYGPTEAAIAVTGWSGEVGGAAARVPLGRPVPGSRVVVRTADLTEAPRCTVGELWIGGTPLGRGYLDDPRETAARFLPDPQGPAGSRMYRSGDLARVREDLLLEFRGRSDDQLKIRGVRVELGEVEAALRGVPRVAAAAARAWRTDQQGRPAPLRLVGYVVGEALTEDEVVRALRVALPAAVVPQRVLVLPALPYGRTHKVDRDRLPHPGVQPPATTGSEPPRHPGLARLWAELLDLDAVDRRQELAAVGGHSLTAAELSLRIRADLRREVGVGEVLACPTYGDLEDIVLGRPQVQDEPIPVLERSRR